MKKLTKQEKGYVAIIIMLLIACALNFKYIKKTATESFGKLFTEKSEKK